MSKRIMNEVMCLAEDLGIMIYYQDTDSMHIPVDKVPMLEQKYKDGQSDVSAEYTLSDKETRSAERMQESISALLDRAVVA